MASSPTTTDFLPQVVSELQHAITQIAPSEAEQLMKAIISANKIFVAGAGRSGLMARAFAMRMMHMGLDAYVIGETITSTFTRDDLLIVSSGSGETRSLVPVAEKAKQLKGTVATVTLNTASTLAQLADVTVKLPGAAKDQQAQELTRQPMGSLFEQTLLLFYDALILHFMAVKGLDSQRMYGQHANLE